MIFKSIDDKWDFSASITKNYANKFNEIPPESSLIKKYVCRLPDSSSIAPTSNATMRDVTLQSI